jgi:hypothetical protein
MWDNWYKHCTNRTNVIRTRYKKINNSVWLASPISMWPTKAMLISHNINNICYNERTSIIRQLKIN